MRRNTVTPTFATDTDGQRIVLVPLANCDKHAKLLLSDFDELIGYGVTLSWVYNENGASKYRYVRCHDRVRRNMSMVARLIMKPGRNKVIRYRDRNPLNLRRENLIVSGGKAEPTIISKQRTENLASAHV